MTSFHYKKITRWFYWSCFLCLPCLFGCHSTRSYAPVVNAWQDPGAVKSRYRVQKDDTLYSIAWAFDLDYRDLARINHLTPPYPLKPGQTLSMQGSHEETQEIKEKLTTFAVDIGAANTGAYQEIKRRPQVSGELCLPEIEWQVNQVLPQCKENKTIVANKGKIAPLPKSGHWQWPAVGRVIKEFTLEGGSKGIDIAGNLCDFVCAAAPGKVVYSGSGLRGYGNLVIIKHSDNYLSAYAYNKRLLVKEGDVVKAGAVIAQMGQNNAGQVLLHFEVRHNGKPVNPRLYL